MDCPRGHGVLISERLDGFEVEACSTCGGKWLDSHELAELEAAAVNDADALRGMVEYSRNLGEMRCPSCQQRMLEFNYRANPLQLDACPEGHGYWLDGGEEQRVRELIRQRSRDLQRAASAESSFSSFLKGMRGKSSRGRGAG